MDVIMDAPMDFETTYRFAGQALRKEFFSGLLRSEWGYEEQVSAIHIFGLPYGPQHYLKCQAMREADHSLVSPLLSFWFR